MKTIEKTIYLDSHATTPVDPEVLHTMIPYFTEFYGNGNHKAGWKTDKAIENARFQVSNLINAKPSEIIFTSGATEAINMALLGLAKANTSERNHIITQKTEHKAVLESVEALKQKGYNITLLKVDKVGRINLEELEKAVTDKTLAVAIMLANNEIGTVQPVAEVGKICRNKGAKYFCDLTQGVGWHAIDVDEMNIDMAALSAHKFYGPRGVGALFLKKSNPKTIIEPILFGGSQERGLRPGTINVPAIVGLGKACEIINSNSKNIYNTIRKLRNRLEAQLFSSIEGIKLNGCPQFRHPGNLNVAIPSVSGERLKEVLPNVMFSTTSACSSTSSKPSHVISALNVSKEVLQSSFRFGINKYNTMYDIDLVGSKLIKVVKEMQYSN